MAFKPYQPSYSYGPWQDEDASWRPNYAVADRVAGPWNAPVLDDTPAPSQAPTDPIAKARKHPVYQQYDNGSEGNNWEPANVSEYDPSLGLAGTFQRDLGNVLDAVGVDTGQWSWDAPESMGDVGGLLGLSDEGPWEGVAPTARGIGKGAGLASTFLTTAAAPVEAIAGLVEMSALNDKLKGYGAQPISIFDALIAGVTPMDLRDVATDKMLSNPFAMGNMATQAGGGMSSDYSGWTGPSTLASQSIPANQTTEQYIADLQSPSGGRDSGGGGWGGGNDGTESGGSNDATGVDGGGVNTEGWGSGGSGGGGGGGGKIVCTAMNEAYGFGSFRQAIWLRHSKNMAPEYQAGYHAIFLPLVNAAYQGKHTWLRPVLEHIARHRTADIRAEMKGRKRDKIGRIERAVLEPLCYIVGKFCK